MLQAALAAENMVGLKMNVPGDKLDQIIQALPSLTSPTVSSLYNSDWFSVETITDEKTGRELIPRLQQQGAEGIIEYSLNKKI